MQPKFIPPVTNRSAPRKFSGTLVAIIVGIIAVMAIGGGLFMILGTKSPVSSMDQLNGRMASLSLYVSEGSKSARNPDVVKLNSDARIIINGDLNTLKTAMATAGAKGATKDVVASEKALGAKTLKELQKASIDGRFDREYLSTMRDQLESTQSLLAVVNKEASQAKVKDATKNAYEHLTTILESLKRIRL
jgi:hypothetical protein